MDELGCVLGLVFKSERFKGREKKSEKSYFLSFLNYSYIQIKAMPEGT
jgi:hypothetical protein